MNINQAFPSNYLRAADLNGKTPTMTITEVKLETVGDDRKLVVYFKGTDKGLVLNKTNANSISDILGSEDTDDWAGKRIMLITAKVEYQGKRVPAIRVEEPVSSGPRPKPEPMPEDISPSDDDIPF